MKRVIVTGATGFIGRHSLAPLVERGYEVHAVGRNAGDTHRGIRWHRVDLLEDENAFRFVSEVKPTHILHFAWYAKPPDYWSSLENLRWVAASLALMRAFVAVGGRRIVSAGTCAEYAWTKTLTCSELTTTLAPATLYGASKHALQQIITATAREKQMSSAWGRVFSLYGPSEHPSRLVSSAILSLLNNQPAICKTGSAVRDYLHVADVASAFVSLLDSEVEGAVNIASGRDVRLGDLVQLIGDKLRRADLVTARHADSNQPQRLSADITRLTELGWTPRFNLDSGLSDTIAWWSGR